METFSLSGVTATTIIDTRRAKAVTDESKQKAKDEYFPVKYRVTFMRKQVYYSTGIDMTFDEWEIMPTTKKKTLIETRDLIQHGFDKLKDQIKSLVKGEGFSIEALNNRLSRGTKNSVLSAFQVKIDELKLKGNIGTSIWYSCARNSIEKFINENNKADLKFSDITPNWLNEYENHLIDEQKKYTTISMYMRAIRAIINDNKEFLNKTQYPFGEGKYEIPTGTGRKMALTLVQIGNVLKHPLLNDKDRMCRDLWFFSYLCNGININDMLRLKYSNISNGEIMFYRQKTLKTTREKKQITAILLPELEQIIDKWGNSDKSQDNYIFPFLKQGLSAIDEKKIIQNVTRMINERMYKIGNALGYGNISTYAARHSYATVLKRSGANIAYISESLGHTDLKTTENYLDSFEKEERQKNAELLTKFE